MLPPKHTIHDTNIFEDRESLYPRPPTNQMAISGLKSVDRRMTPEQALENCEDLSQYVRTDVEARQAKTGDKDAVVAPRPEDVQEDRHFAYLQSGWKSVQRDLPDDNSLASIAQRESHAASAFYMAADRHDGLAARTEGEKGENDHLSGMVAIALKQRAICYNEVGVRHEARAVIAQSGLDGLMEKTGRTEEGALDLVKSVKGAELLESYDRESAQKKGANVEGLWRADEMRENMDAKHPDRAGQISQLRQVMISAHMSNLQEEEGLSDREMKIKSAAYRSHAKDIDALPLTHPSSVKFNKQLSQNFPRSDSFGKMMRQANMTLRAEQEQDNER